MTTARRPAPTSESLVRDLGPALGPYRGPATLVLADGRVFRGLGFGGLGTAIGEVVFNTAMSGYQEIITDPSYTKQLVCLTASEIGNVGVNREDEESRGHGCAGLLVRSLSPVVSNYRAEQPLAAYLEARGIPGMAEFDTRALTRHIREAGAMMAALSTELHDADALLERVRAAPGMEGADLASQVSTPTIYSWDQRSWDARHNASASARTAAQADAPADVHIVVVDFGVKHNILRRLRDAGARSTVVPHTTTVAQLLALAPDGVLLSNGPGDPAACESAILEIRSLLKRHPALPVFGICLGHQILCLALGGRTYKLKFGHHGGNHPVRDERSGAVAITSQNHGFAVDLESISRAGAVQGVELTQVNLFDQTVAGFALTGRPVSGVQYHPEDAPGPHDAGALIQTFVRDVRSRIRSRRDA